MYYLIGSIVLIIVCFVGIPYLNKLFLKLKCEKLFRKFGDLSDGNFKLSGYSFLSNAEKEYFINCVKPGDSVKLLPDPKNKFDSEAIKVTHRNIFIGWVSRSYYLKRNLFFWLILNKPIFAKISKLNLKDGKYAMVMTEPEIEFKTTNFNI